MVQAGTIQPPGEFQFLGWPQAFLRDRRSRQDRSAASKIGRSERPAQRTLDRKRGTARVGILSHVGNDLKSAVMCCRAGMREVLVRRVVGMAIRRRIASGHGDLKLRHPLIPQNSRAPAPVARLLRAKTRGARHDQTTLWLGRYRCINSKYKCHRCGHWKFGDRSSCVCALSAI